jgi:hypothetical protein
MAREQPVGFDHTLTITAPATKVLGAFFEPWALAAWWDVSRSIAVPRPLGVYALEWAPAEATDDLLGRLGGTFHGTVMDFKAGRTLLVADAYFLPPDSDPVGPMAFEVTCSSRRRLTGVVDLAIAKLHAPAAPPNQDAPDAVGSPAVTSLHIVLRGYEESARWRRYYELLGVSLPAALEKLKDYLERGRGVWDLRAW